MRPFLLIGIVLVAAVLLPVSLWSLIDDTTVANGVYYGALGIMMIFLVVLSTIAAYKLNNTLASRSDRSAAFLKKVQTTSVLYLRICS
jgi:hypothetical protein